MKRFPALHLPSIRGRARADRGPLLLTALVVFLAVLFAGAVPPLIERKADRAVGQAVQQAGDSADLSVQGQFDLESPYPPRYRDPASADFADQQAVDAKLQLDPRIDPLFGPPLLTVSSTVFEVKSGTTPGRYAELVYAGDPAVVWTKGEAPQANPARDTVRRTLDPWPVQVGLSEATAALLEAGPGDTVLVKDPNDPSGEVPMVISGLYRPQDPAEELWRTEPGLVQPRIVTDSRNLTTSFFGALMSRDSLPDGRLATNPQAFRITTRFRADLDQLDRAGAEGVISALRTMKAGPDTGYVGPPLEFSTSLDTVLRRVLDQIVVGGNLATVFLTAVLTALGLTLLLTAELLTRRRSRVLVGTRQRGAGLPGIAAELSVESLLLVLLAGSAAVLLAQLVAGEISWNWALPVLAVAAGAAPVLGVLFSARATARKSTPANRSARRNQRITRQLRRLVLETAVVLATGAAYVALQQRGVATQEGLGATLLPAFAPTLFAITAGVLLIRLIPVLLRGLLRLATRLDGSLPLLAASRAAATAGRPLPVILLLMSVALTVFALTVWATAGQEPPVPEDGRPMPSALADGLGELSVATAAVMILLAALALALGAAASSPDRAQTQARLRTLGLSDTETRWVTAGELLPVALLGALAGWLVGRALAQQAVGLLALRVLGGVEQDPPLIVPVVTGLPPVLVLLVLAVIVAVETSRRRRERLGLVLRA